MEKRKITEKAPNLDAALAVKDTMVGGTRQKLDALNKKKREAFGKETYQLDLSALDTYSMSPYKKPTLLSTGAKVSSSGKEKSLYGATGQTHGEEDKPYSFLPGILGMHPKKTEHQPSLKRISESDLKDSNNNLALPAVNESVSLQKDEVATLMAGIVTGADAINFFARFGSETLVKFMHMVPEFDRELARQHPKYYHPYNLLVAARSVSGIEHFIMSPAGLVHMKPGESSECIPLGTWMRESVMFSILRRIPFFRLYLYRKVITTWSENVRYALYAKQRLKVQERLFATRKTSSAQLLAIKRLLQEMHKVSVLQLESKTWDLEEFAAQTSKRSLEAGKEIDELVQKVIVEVEAVISDVTNVYNKASQDVNSLATSFSDDVVADKNKSLVKIKEEKQQLRLLRVKAKLEYSSLPDFIRYVDLMVAESLIALLVNSVASFNNALQQDDTQRGNRKAGLFEIVVRYNPLTDSHAFSPTREQVLHVIESVVSNPIEAIGGVNRVSRLNQKSTMQGLEIQSTVRENRDFASANASILARIEEDFVRAAEHTTSYQVLKPMHRLTNFLEDLNMDQPDVNTVREKLDKIANWGKEIEKLRNKSIGVLEIESKRLKAELEGIREAKLKEVKEFIRDASREKCTQLLEYYRECLTKLGNKPTYLKEFAAYLSSVELLKLDQNRHFKSTNQVDLLYKLLTEIDATSASGTSADQETIFEILDELHGKEDAYRVEMAAVKTYKESQMEDMSKSLDSLLEKLNDSVAFALTRLRDAVFTTKSSFYSAPKVLEELELLGQKVESLEQAAQTYAGYQRIMGKPVTANPELDLCHESLEHTKALWEAIRRWTDNEALWMTADFTTINVEDVEKEVQALFRESYALNKASENEVSEQLKVVVSNFRTMMPTILDLGNAAMQSSHYEKLFNTMGIKFTSPFSLTTLLEGKVLEYKEQVSEISGIASGEAQLIADLQKIGSTWETIQFVIVLHRDQPGLYVLGPLEEIFLTLEDNQVALQTMLGSRYVPSIQDKVEEWVKRLSTLSEMLDEWTTCQRNWMYLECIFGAEDIQKQLPTEAQMFGVIDRSFKNIMTRTAETPLVIASLQPLDDGKSVLEAFLSHNSGLEAIQKSLEDYLETKRMAFPRFYFLSNDELLEILSQTRDPLAVAPHMGKCFDAVKSLKFQETKKVHEIVGFADPSGEFVPMSHAVKAEGAVEAWLLQFEKGMRVALYDQAKNALLYYPSTDEGSINRAEWLWGSCAQVIIIVDQIIWTMRLEGALSSTNPLEVGGFLEFSLKQIDAMVGLVRTPLDKQRRTLLGALLTIDVHARDVVRSLVAGKVNSLSNFEWTKQLRYYWDEKKDDAFVKQTNSSFRYGYEYLGNGPRLVITPLTDVCYMTLTGALHMRLGGAPSGPAGTGKTETTKDLAKALAVYCVVFNCSDGLDYKIMGRFFSGLAQQGAWACFDEFNRIDVEVLSVIAQQVLSIQQAIMRRAADLDFEGRVIPINFAFGVFITMNPGYAGRTELPDNLKSLFRPVAMMVPDYRLIAEIMLFSEGFANALPLSNKMAQLYALSSEQLSKQDHYDFGMRAVKSVLVAAGQLKRKEPESNEDMLLIRAMRDSNVPKFLEQDLPLFGGILKDLFPGIVVPFVDYGKLQSAIETTLSSMKLQRNPQFISKVIQSHETQLVRHGMMVVGETGAGKSTSLHVLAASLALLYAENEVDRDGFYKNVDRLILNPKAITAGELYGEFTKMTGEWKDGIVPKLVRDCVNSFNEGLDTRKWVIFDGPVDAVWIENMNTVLDDNKTLCLANSERIKLPPTLHMIFEVQDLRAASPATVSRCGMVYMEQVHVGIVSLIRSWGITGLKSVIGLSSGKTILGSIEAHLPSAVEFARRDCKERIPSTDNQLVSSFLNLFAACLRKEPDPVLLSQDLDLMLALMVWSIVWSVSANLADESRPAFIDWCSERFSSVIGSNYTAMLEDPFNWFLDLSANEIKPWTSLIPQFVFDGSMPYFDILVPTVETTRYRYVMDVLMRSGHNVLFMAETGVGKSVVINSFLKDMVDGGTVVSYTMGFSAQTKPSNLREVLETKLEKKRKNLLGAPTGKKMYLFVDDVNMPVLEVYGAQPPNELLRQVLGQGGFYDVEKLFFKSVTDVVCVAACAPPGGGRNELSPRLVKQFHMIWLTNLAKSSLNRIFSSIVQGFLSQHSVELGEQAVKLVRSSVEIYGRIQKDLLPSPLRAHYTFNLRDLSKVFQGVLMMRPELHADKASLLRLWCHEGSRVFRDRLISQEDADWYNSVVLEQLQVSLGEPEWTVDSFADNIFGSFGSKKEKVYMEMAEVGVITSVLTDYLDDYNSLFSSKMDLVFFRDAVSHVSRISRILSQPRGNALLVGVGGSGRRSLTRMAAFMADYKCCSIEITRGYGIDEWREDLKGILMTAGAKNQPTVFLFSDTQLVMESFLEDINNILNSGEVPNLFESDEMEKIVSLVRPLAKLAGKGQTREAVLLHFISLVRTNLHVVLCMSPIGAGFRTRCRLFPSLVNCCTIDWFAVWPEEALISVATRAFEAQKDINIKEYIPQLARLCNTMHMAVKKETINFFNELKRYNYTTPTSYLELIKLYVDILRTQQLKTKSNEARYRTGLDKLRETEEVVAQLELRLTEMQPVLERASIETSELLVQVGADQEHADVQAAIVEQDVHEANKVAASVMTIKTDCEADLAEAMPAYEAAVEALRTLDKKSLQELKGFANPPEMVKFTMEAVCILFDKTPDWNESKKLLSQMDLMERLKDYDKDNIPAKFIKKLQKYYTDPRFVPEEIRKISTSAMSLCMWSRAMVTYDKVAKGIEPKKAALREAEEQLAQTMAELDVKKKGLAEIRERVAELQRTLRDTEARKAELEAQADAAQKQLVRAGLLIGGLGGEKIRWQSSAAELEASLLNLVGDMALSAGFIAYLGPFTAGYRSKIVKQWEQTCRDFSIPCTKNFSLMNSLSDPVTVRMWQLNGLPADEFSCENGILASLGRRWPLMIDPQGQANRWIRSMYGGDAGLKVTKLSEKDFLRTLENSIRYGSPVLLENVGQDLDPGLEPVLLKQVFKKGGQNLMRLGDTDVPYSDEFKLFITTKLSNPHYMPEVCIKVTVINFTVTKRGLEDQLLVDVIKNERPDLEERRDALVVSIAADQKQLRDLEEQILSMLASASGNILDDEQLIDALALSKRTSTAITLRLTEAETTTKEINSTREEYRVIATRGSVLYFVVANLSSADPMYSYSMQYYKGLVLQRLVKTEKRNTVKDRSDLLIEDLTRSIYLNVCRGVFEKDKLLFAFLCASSIEVDAKIVSAVEWQLFLVGVPLVSDINEQDAFPDALEKEGVPKKQWICALGLRDRVPSKFYDLTESMCELSLEWAKFLKSENPHVERMPGRFEYALSCFDRLLLIRVLREEKVVFAVKRYVELTLGKFFAESPSFDLEGAFEDSTNVSPLIFVLSPGADPTDYLLQLAESKGKRVGLRIISLGQGQGPVAERALEASFRSGDWVCLQNCHLAVSWLSKLEQIVERMQGSPDSVHKSFRLWLTSMPSAGFPVPILQSSIKVTNEPPRGLRANLTRTFNDISNEEYEGSTKAAIFKTLAFATAFFNALILERRKFGAVGWNIPYDWMNSDLKAAMSQLRMYVEEQAEVPWQTLNVVVSDIIYGGRVTDVWDKRTISSILRKYFVPDLLLDGFLFSEEGHYYATGNVNLEAQREYIRGLPTEDSPETFGLHANASITLQQKESRSLIASVVLCSESGGGATSSGDSNDVRVSEAAAKLTERMPNIFDMRTANPATFRQAHGAVHSLGVFLSQELIRFNELIEVIGITLRELRKAIKGEVVMSSDLETMYNCFVFQKVPPAWESAGYPCLKPLAAWIEDFLQRIQFMSTWLLNGPPNAYWVSGFFFPQGFMTAVKQAYSRDNHIAVDTLKIGCDVTTLTPTDIKADPDFGAYIYGLFLEGGRFDRDSKRLQDSIPRVLFDTMPCIWLKPVSAAKYKPESVYNCPLYKTSIRAGTLSTTGHSTNFVVALPIPSDITEDHWIRRGCAMLCMLDE